MFKILLMDLLEKIGIKELRKPQREVLQRGLLDKNKNFGKTNFIDSCGIGLYENHHFLIRVKYQNYFSKRKHSNFF